jgi:zinc protease
MNHRSASPLRLLGVCLLVSFASRTAVEAQPTSTPAAAAPIQFSQETLPNGLHVIYAPLHQAPVVQVRVFYHVGSRDERPDRQGFAHMFEHMMFRGSAHVAPQEHMRLVDGVGGICNAFTSFDETVYHDTLPSEHLEMALYLEADRMSSFKVNDDIYRTERKVVAEEWGMKENRPYGNLYEDYLKTAFTTHSYRWTPIGNMQHLAAAPVSELQDFFNTYYLPNNATLVIAGDIDPTATKAMVQKYFAWIPRGADVPRRAEPEPPQTSPRAATIADPLAPHTAIVVGWHTPEYKSDDNYALSVLSAILGEGASSRLQRLVGAASEHPLCDSAETVVLQLEDGGVFGVSGIVMQGKNGDDVERMLKQAVADVIAKGVNDDELAKAKMMRRVELIKQRTTAEQIAGQLGEEAIFGGDANRVNQDLAKLDAVTAADVKAVAAKYLQPQGETTLRMVPDPLGTEARKAATMAAALTKKDAPVAPSTEPIQARVVSFPADYPTKPPIAEPRSTAAFEHGTEADINGLHVVVLPDHRLPLVNWNLAMRRGSHCDPAGKEGLADLTDAMLRRGAGKLTEQQLSDELESHGISLAVKDDGDVTRLAGSTTTEQLDRGMARTRDVLLSPTFPPDEFDKVKELAISGLIAMEHSPGAVADRDLVRALFGGTPLGHPATPASVGQITLDDVKQFYADNYHPNDAALILSGDVTVERGQQLARELTDGWQPKDMPAVDYTLPPVSKSRRIILVDGPAGKGGAVIRMGTRAYDIHTDEKYAGSLASTILSAGIESRLNEYVRAERGYVYGVSGIFQPGRHAGSFLGNTETKLVTTADTIEAMFKVFNDLRQAEVTPEELATAKRRVAGNLVMSMQTIARQAEMRSDGILNGYPVDYYDRYAGHVAAVTAEQVRDLMRKFVDPASMTVVVVAPAAEVKEQLQRLGEVQVMPMPAKRGGEATTEPSSDLLKSTK